MSSLMQPLTMFLGNVQYVLVAVVGGLRVASGAISVGDVQAFIQYSRTFSMPLTQLASMMNVFQSGIASLERVLELLDAEEQSPDDRDADSPAPVRGRVDLRGRDVLLRPRPPPHRGPRPGGRAGPDDRHRRARPAPARRRSSTSSCGSTSSTAARSPSTAATSRRSPGRSCARSIGMVLQDTWLFGGTIRDNIAYGNPDATEAQILEAARATYVDRFVHSLPEGYDTLINEEGDNISAGQKQLLTIARAFLARPAILILDEATCSVDTRTEVQIQEAMNAPADRPHELRDRPPALDDPRRRHDPRDGGRAHRRAGQPRASCSPTTAPTTASTTPSSQRPPPTSNRSPRRWTSPRQPPSPRTPSAPGTYRGAVAPGWDIARQRQRRLPALHRRPSHDARRRAPGPRHAHGPLPVARQARPAPDRDRARQGRQAVRHGAGRHARPGRGQGRARRARHLRRPRPVRIGRQPHLDALSASGPPAGRGVRPDATGRHERRVRSPRLHAQHPPGAAPRRRRLHGRASAAGSPGCGAGSACATTRRSTRSAC